MRTRLSCFNPEEQGRLINFGYALCDAELKKAGIVVKKVEPVAKFPEPDYPL